MKIQWLDTFELGVPEIDGDHRTLVRLMGSIEGALETHQDKKDCLPLIERLFAFCEDHFRREETLLRSWGYGEVAPHMRYHRDLMDRADRIKRTCVDSTTTDSFATCCDELMRFLIDDVVRGDLSLKSFLDYNGLTIAR